MEQWKDIEGYDWVYQISSLWRVKSLKKYNGISRIIKQQIHPRWWHSRVSLVYKWRYKQVIVSRLVAIEFIPNPLNLPIVCHKDETLDENWALYNWVDNLYWGTYKDNAMDRDRKWRSNNHFVLNHPKPNKWKLWKDNPNSKPINQYTKDWIFVKTWDSARCVTRELWINYTNICTQCKWRRLNQLVWWFKWSFK